MPNSLPAKNLAGVRVLVIEDQALIAMDICGFLEDEGLIIVGPAYNLDQAKVFVKAGGFDIALVDANLNGKPVDDIAASLEMAGIPYAFCSGYGQSALPRLSAGRVILSKPFEREDLLDVVATLCCQLAQAAQ